MAGIIARVITKLCEYRVLNILRKAVPIPSSRKNIVQMENKLQNRFDKLECLTFESRLAGINDGNILLGRICLTHSCPMKDANTFIGKYDCSSQQKQFLCDFLNEVEYNHYDILIQLCDAISLPNGACIMEKRLIDVALRHGLRDFTIEKWKAFMNTKKYFDELCSCNIYTLLPNVLENSSVNLI